MFAVSADFHGEIMECPDCGSADIKQDGTETLMLAGKEIVVIYYECQKCHYFWDV